MLAVRVPADKTISLAWDKRTLSLRFLQWGPFTLLMESSPPCRVCEGWDEHVGVVGSRHGQRV